MTYVGSAADTPRHAIDARDGIAFVALLNYDVLRGNTVSP
jgi:hypothetical protein